jgi:hypothetical protein
MNNSKVVIFLGCLFAATLTPPLSQLPPTVAATVVALAADIPSLVAPGLGMPGRPGMGMPVVQSLLIASGAYPYPQPTGREGSGN